MRALRRQRGATLVVALVMLTLLALFAFTAHRTSLTDLKTAGNSQARMEALNAAQEAIELTISTPQFVTSPADAISTPCGGPNALCTDFNNDGVAEYQARLEPQPSCIAMKVIPSVELDLTNSEDLGCSVGQGQQFGIAGVDTAASESLCANTTWNLTAKATATASGATVSVSQGVGIRVGTSDMASACL
jgi:Tfp pilus assembly protein PilX